MIDKPIQFSSQLLRTIRYHFTHFLEAGGLGTFCNGILPVGILVAIKVLNGSSYKKIQDRFLAEVRINHINLVKLFGFWLFVSERDLQALVYEYVGNGSPDGLLFHRDRNADWETLQNIATDSTKGIKYLHKDCK